MQYRREIDGLRALAVVPVVLYHAGLQFFSGGFVGVDVFFVISGYLITGILLSDLRAGKFSIVDFYERRARRILPALFLVVACCIPFALAWLLPRDLKEFTQSTAATALFSSNIFFFRKIGYFDPSSDMRPLLHTWSLAVEEQFYVFFPLLLAALWRFWPGRARVVLAVLAVASLAAAEWLTRHNPSAAFFLLPTRAWELLVGSLIAMSAATQHKAASGPLAEAGSALGLGMLVCSVLFFETSTRVPGLPALVPVLGTALIIVFATPRVLVGRLLGARPLVGVGLISYSAYLWHQPALAFARLRLLGEPPLWLVLAIVVGSFGMAYLSWRYVERPFRVKSGMSRRPIFAAAAAGSVALVVFGVAGYVTAGFHRETLTSVEPFLQCEGRLNKDGLCEFGNPASKRVLALVGDSHAHQYSQALNDAIGADFRIVMVTCNSCFLGESMRFDAVAESTKAIEAARAQLQKLRAYDVEAVVRVQRWQGYGLTSEKAITEAVRDGLHFWGVSYRRMIVVGSTSEVDYRCHLAEAYRLFEPRRCVDSAEDREANRAFMRATQAMHVPGNVHFVYPYEQLCPGDQCVVREGNVMIYRDQNHVTLAGAKRVADAIRRELQAPAPQP